MSTLTLAPTGRRASHGDVESWIAGHADLVLVVDAAIAALGIGEPYINVGPAYFTSDDGKPAHLRRGATWFVNGHNVGFRVEFYGPRLRIVAWGRRTNISLDLFDVSPETLASDLWTVLSVAGFVEDDKVGDL